MSASDIDGDGDDDADDADGDEHGIQDARRARLSSCSQFLDMVMPNLGFEGAQTSFCCRAQWKVARPRLRFQRDSRSQGM